jgi:hypothetical protein
VGRGLSQPAGQRRPRQGFRLLHVFDMAEDGRIRRENVWLDLAAILRQLGAVPGD